MATVKLSELPDETMLLHPFYGLCDVLTLREKWADWRDTYRTDWALAIERTCRPRPENGGLVHRP